jgi:predicted ATP-dependent endonuclease of OLD family
MKLIEITLKNVKSFNDKQVVTFHNGLNMFIGSNASGKSNLMDVIHTVLKYYFVYPWKYKTVTEQELPFSYVVIDSIEDGRSHYEPIERYLDKNLQSENEGQKIKLKIEVTKADILGMETIKKNMQRLTKVERDEFKSSHMKKIELEKVKIDDFTGKIFEYEIVNNKSVAISDQAHADVFLNYLHHHELIRYYISKINEISSDKYIIDNLAPAFQYLSSTRTARGRMKSESGLNEAINIFKQIKEEPVIFSLKMKNELETSKEKKKIIQEKEYEELLKSVIKKMGYESIMMFKSEKEKGYELMLKKGKTRGRFTKASSGELQILDFLFSTIINRMDGGMIMIGEPELHLYPQRQRVMLDLIEELSDLFNLQFIIVTHSPWMIDSDTIEHTFRVYKEDETSKVYSPSVSMLAETNARDLVLIVNALNNEKMFFSEKVILVEGIADRIIFETILRIIQEEKSNYEAIEIIDVYGADGDYVDDLMRERKNKIDRKSFINRLREEGIYILPGGNLEDYFHQGHFDIDEAIGIAQQIISGNRVIPKEFNEIIRDVLNK